MYHVLWRRIYFINPIVLSIVVAADTSSGNGVRVRMAPAPHYREISCWVRRSSTSHSITIWSHMKSRKVEGYMRGSRDQIFQCRGFQIWKLILFLNYLQPKHSVLMEPLVHQLFHQCVTLEGISFILSSLLNMSSIIDLYLTDLFLFIICFSRHLSVIHLFDLHLLGIIE
jgi:hypothetical protein